MKKQLIVAVIAACFSITAANAQGGGNFQRRTPEDRVKVVHEKMDSTFKLDADKMKQVDDIFLSFYLEQDKKMDEMRAGGGTPDRDAMMAERKKLVDERDTKLKAVLTEEQMKTFKDQVEPSLRPQRGNRGGGK